MQKPIKNILIKFEDNFLLVEAANICKLTLKLFSANGFMAQKINTIISEGTTKLNLENLQNGEYAINAFTDDEFVHCFKVNI